MEGAVEADHAAPPVGVLLAAGEGRRMGQPKALVRDPDGTSWLLRAVDSLAAAGCEPVIVVLGAEAERAARLLEERSPSGPSASTSVRWVEATDWSHGMGASLRRGLQAAAATDATTAVVTLVDLTDVGPDVVTRVVEAVGDDAGRLGRAAYRGAPGHPVVLGREHWAGVVEDAVGDRGARDYLAVRDVVGVECSDLASGADRDTPPAVSDAPTRGDDRRVQPTVESAADLTERLGRTGYLVDDALATIGYLALALQRPLLVEGEPGTGKTALAEALAQALEVPLIRLQCYEGI